MTTSARWIIRRSDELPRGRRLRAAAESAASKGASWFVLIAAPPPVLGSARSKRVETLIVDGRAAQAHLGRLRWGRWDSDHGVIDLERGRCVDLSGRAAAVGRSAR